MVPGMEEISVLVYAGALFFLSQIGGRIAKSLGSPRLVGYLVTGIVFGPSALGFFSWDLVNDRFAIITEIALAIIAFSIGGSLRLDKLRRSTGTILWITVSQAVVTFFMVAVFTYWAMPWVVTTGHTGADLTRTFLPVAIILGAASAATAPAAIISVVHEYRAKGTLTTVLLGLVALDDALVLVFYSFAEVLAKILTGGHEGAWSDALLRPLLAVFLIIGAGILAGVVLRYVIRFFSSEEALLGLVIGIILLTSGAVLSFGHSPLLAAMVLGFIVGNYTDLPKSEEIFGVVNRIEEPIFGAFFLLAGAHLDLRGIAGTAGLSLIILVSRFGGKLAGSYAGGVLSGAPGKVKRNLGFALLPQAGVAMGLVLKASNTFSADLPVLSDLMVSGIVGATLVNELFSPFLVRRVLRNAGETSR